MDGVVAAEEGILAGMEDGTILAVEDRSRNYPGIYEVELEASRPDTLTATYCRVENILCTLFGPSFFGIVRRLFTLYAP